MKWEEITSLEQINTLIKNSENQPVVIYKHSTRCGISSMTIDRLERAWKDEEMQGVKPYFLNLISYRDISQAIADTFGIRHESPQLLLIKDGECTFHASHMGISYQALKNQVERIMPS
jgi:bacillithiol system protein YtxJ